MPARLFAWSLLVALLAALPGCCMVGIGCCTVDVDLSLGEEPADDWTAPRITIVSALLADSEKDWLVFESRDDLARWIGDRDLSPTQRDHKQQLDLEGRLLERELRVSGERGVVQVTAPHAPGDIEAHRGVVRVFANYAGADPAGLEFRFTGACRYGVRLHADGRLEPVDEPGGP